VIREPACGLHQGQQPCGAARTGRTHGCTRPVLIAKQKLLRRRGRPHMDLQRPHHCTTTLVQGPSTPSRHNLNQMASDNPGAVQTGRMAARLQHRQAALETGRAHPRRDRKTSSAEACPGTACHPINHQPNNGGSLPLSGNNQGSTS
jgi:hypothetical protein